MNKILLEIVYVSFQNLCTETSVIIFGGRTFGGWLGHKDEIKETLKFSLPRCHVRAEQEDSQSMNRKQTLMGSVPMSHFQVQSGHAGLTAILLIVTAP